MIELDLAGVGLPGARLPAGFSLPAQTGLSIAARGGPAYSSVAAVWHRSHDAAFKVRSDIGSDRRLWVSIRLASGTDLQWCIFYFPPGNTAEALERWSAELDGLEEDLAKLHASEVVPAILVTGDTNL